ncbi:unnamed protein product [Rotaria magnacalcarata]|uniref:SKICH domain-containing protein n=2 Tax=Rotaria magnacalcarata TaxID=392030 RepID=A0A817ALZ6_9BILA|nr:unnamed protein product [Rotaria magnacalcarata]CAF4045404.1 unnamed protein product [Rotaria magnacalcarata]
MSDINDHLSDTSSDLNWPLDHSIERQPDDRVVFENVADQYVKGADVTAYFTILHDIKVNPKEDQIGLLRVGYTNIKECVAYAPVQFNLSASSESTCHGIATFPSASLPVTDDEFYQFCYILNKTKNLGSSIPFQLNCASDDIDLLSNAPVRKTKPGSFIALADNDNDDFLVIHTKQMLTEEKLRHENRQLLEMNRRFASQNDEYKAKLELIEAKVKEQREKICNEMQELIASHKTAIDELSSRQQLESKLRAEYDKCRSLCNQYQTESLQHAERCRTSEDSHARVLNEANQIRSQLAITSQLTKDQATQIIDLQRRLMQADELSKSANQRQALLEQQLRDLSLTSEKNQKQLDTYAKQITEKDEQIIALQTTNNLLQEESNSLKADYKSSVIVGKRNEELQQQIDQLSEQHRIENESAQQEIESLKIQLNDVSSSQQVYMALKNSFSEIEKRCVRHQKSEIEAKRLLGACNKSINDLQRTVIDLKTRLSTAADEYKKLYLKSIVPEHNRQHEQSNPTTLVNESPLNNDTIEDMLRSLNAPEPAKNEDRHELENNITLLPASLTDANSEIGSCPMCYWEFPKRMTLDEKKDHIEQHFTSN